MAWYSHLFQNFPQFIVIHTVKGLHLKKVELILKSFVEYEVREIIIFV